MYISIQPLLNTLLQHLWQPLQPHVFWSTMLQAWHTYFSSLQDLSSSIRWDGNSRCTVIFRSLQRCSIGFKTGLWLGHSGTFTELSLLCYLGCVLSVVVLLENEGVGFHKGCLSTLLHSSFP